MGVVYRAQDTLLEREVALKVIGASIEGNPELRERFFREARAAGQLSHRNIITIHDLGEHDGQPYLAMEFLKGEDLQRRLSRPETLTLARKLEIAAEICDGLSYAHRRGFVHRDIKPANIFITEEGVVKLLDFGLARMVSSEMTSSNMMVGTLNYMAPEQVRGERTDHRADIFSFGVVLYEILSGRKAFQGDSFATTLYKILQDVPEPLLNIDATLPYEVVRLVEKAIAKSRDERYQDLSELARDLSVQRQHLSMSDAPTFSLPQSGGFRPPSDPPRPATVQRADSGQRPLSAPHVLDSSAPTMLSEVPAGLPATPPDVPERAPVREPAASRGRRRAVMAGVAAAAVLAAGALWSANRQERAPALDARQPAPTEQQAPAAQTGPPPPPAAVGAPTATIGAGSSATPGDDPGPPAEARSVDDARARMARAKAAATQAGARQGSRPFAAALAAEREGQRLYSGKRLGDAAAKFYEAAGLYRSAELAPDPSTGQTSNAKPHAQGSPAPAPEPAATAVAPPPAAPAAPAPTATAPGAPGGDITGQLPPAGVPGPPIPPPVRSTAPAPVPPASPRSTEEDIREVVRRYEQALESRSVEALRRIWPSLQGAQEQALRQEFSHARQIDVEIDNLAVAVNGNAATVTFVRRYQLATTDGQRLLTSSRTTMSLRRAANDWLIERVRYETIR